MPLRKIPLGMTVHNIEMQPGRGGQLCRSRPVQCDADGPRREVGRRSRCPPAKCAASARTCRATIGMIGNAEHMNISLGKAGRKRWLGRKPHNRGTSMNPVDHPMGGGEGRTAGGRHPCSPTGVLAKGGKTAQEAQAVERGDHAPSAPRDRTNSLQEITYALWLGLRFFRGSWTVGAAVSL